MRIAQVVPWFYPHLGGVESHVMSLSRELASRGHEITVVTTRSDPTSPERERFDGYDVLRVKPRAVVLRTPIVPRIRNALQSLPLDLVHAHSPPPMSAYYASKVTEARRLPIVVTYHCDIEIPSILGPLVESLFRRTLGASTLRRATRVIVTTRTYAATSRVLWRHNPAIIPNAVDHERFHPGVDGSSIRQRLGIPDGKPIVLLVCRVVPHKGVEHLVEAARYVPDAEFLIVGEGSSLVTMRRLARTLGVSHHVRFLGRVSQEDLPKVYAACDVFVLPSVSRLEAFGIAALEAMSTEKPVVVADIPGLREVIEDGREGLLADPVNPQDLAEKIRRLLADPLGRQAMGRRGREKVVSSFSVKIVSDQIEALYRSVLQGPATG